jgi:hypothetical protein
MIFRLLTILSITAILTGCSETDSNRGIKIQSAPIKIDIAKTADPAAVNMLPVHFRVVNKDNFDSFISTISKQQNTTQPVFIAITTQDYENLSLNLADLRRYIEQQQSVIIYYRTLTNSDNIPSTKSN